MRPDLLRPLLGGLGIAIGFLVYGWANQAPEPWPRLLVGSMFVALGGSAWVYARGERWIQVLGVVLAVYGVLRMLGVI